MAQNVYDDAEFFAQYATLRRSQEGLDGAPEWPTLRAMLPPLQGKRVLDLGCGYGWFCRWARAAGAASVLGIDLSERMLERARADTSDPAITYLRASIDSATLDAASFDVVYSSLALHYIADFDALCRSVARALVPGGHFVFSVEHPIYSARTNPAWFELEGRKVWPVDSYLDEGERRSHWLGRDVVKYHRTIASYVSAHHERLRHARPG